MKSITVMLVSFSAIIVSVNCCLSNTDCLSSNFLCTNGECVCKKGFLLSADKTKCLPYVTEYMGKCSEDAQCEWLGENSKCQYVCRCEEGYRWYLGKCMKYVGLGENCNDNLDCYDGYNPQALQCSKGRCECSDGYYQRGDTDCRKKALAENDTCALDIDCQFSNAKCVLGKCTTHITKSLEIQEDDDDVTKNNFNQAFTPTPCQTNENCTDITTNSECYEKTGTCVCKRGYFFNEEGTECIPEIGMNIGCDSSSSCKLRPGKCVDGACFCRDYYFVEEGNRNCIKTISQNNWNCVSKEWCYALGTYSYCSSSKICNCSKLSDFDEENVLCKWNGSEDPDMCSSDYGCMYKNDGNWRCIDEKCGCRDSCIHKDGVCIPYIGAPCDEKTGCLENATCVDIGGEKICQCNDGFISYQNESCVPRRDHLGDDCKLDIQCSDTILYSKCVNGNCNCDEEYIPYNDRCYEKKKYDSYCSNLLECQLSLGDTFQCRKGVCQCPTGQTLQGDKCSSSGIESGNIYVVIFALVLKGVLSVFC